jgi:hypothetical protein
MNGLPLTYRTSELQMRSKSVSLLHWMSGSLMRWMSGLLYRWYRLHERRRFLPLLRNR